jgi:hypothetical protein
MELTSCTERSSNLYLVLFQHYLKGHESPAGPTYVLVADVVNTGYRYRGHKRTGDHFIVHVNVTGEQYCYQ